MSRLALQALEDGRLEASDELWVAMRLRQGRFSPAAMAMLDDLARGRVNGDRVEEACRRRAKRLGWRGGFEEIGLIEKWLENEGLHGYFVN